MSLKPESKLPTQTKMFTFFWHKTSMFSQWYPTEFFDVAFKYTSAEQYMMAKKAQLFGDLKTMAVILRTSDPKKCKALGRTVAGFDESAWKNHRVGIVYEGNYLKFAQNPKLKKQLLLCAGTTMAEASPYDKIWGIGIRASHPHAKKPSKWPGQNLLGKVLTDLCSDLGGGTYKGLKHQTAPTCNQDLKHQTASKCNQIPSKKFKLAEKKGDLFKCRTSMAHCVSMDMNMGMGIAKAFKSKFGNLNKLKAQLCKVGQIAHLTYPSKFTDPNGIRRRVYYIVTKSKYWQKPTYQSFATAISALKNKCVKHKITKLGIPRIGCGLDRLEWKKVKLIISAAFKDTDVEITAYHLVAQSD
jgi:ribA/ribD-fused uncharacterized protein